MRRRPIANRWQSEIWEPVGVLDDYEGPQEARLLVEAPEGTQWLYPGLQVSLHRSLIQVTLGGGAVALVGFAIGHA